MQEVTMFIYSVKFVCGTQNLPATPVPVCTPVRVGLYSTEINIHNFNPQTEAVIQKRAMVLIHNDAPDGREPRFVRARPFDQITLPPDSATMDDCCGLSERLQFSLAHLN